MRSADLVSREWCDLVFEGRNRSYGAYRLRQEAGRRYARALLGMALGLFFAIGAVWGVSAYVSLRSDRELVRLLEELRRMEALQQKDAHLLRFVDTHPRKDVREKVVAKIVPEIVEQPTVTTQVVEDIMPPVEEITDTLFATPLPADTTTHEVVESPTLPPLTPTEIVQEMPEFPGGITALMQWLDKNVIYPPLVVQQKVSGTTFLTFLVDREGEVMEPEVQEPLHPMITSAILKAARRMPRWEPGKKDGQVAIVRVTIPIEYHSN